MHRSHRLRAHPVWSFPLAPPLPAPSHHPFSRRLTGAHGYIRLEIKSAIVSPLNELSHAYAYSRSSARVCVYSRSIRLLHARILLARAHKSTRTCVCATTVGALCARARLPVRVRLYAALRAFTGTKIQVPRGPGVHRGPTRRPRHVFATPAHRCLGAALADA